MSEGVVFENVENEGQQGRFAPLVKKLTKSGKELSEKKCIVQEEVKQSQEKLWQQKQKHQLNKQRQ
jgi:hypothetical protein